MNKVQFVLYSLTQRLCVRAYVSLSDGILLHSGFGILLLPSIHQSIYLHLSGVVSYWQEAKQGILDVHLSSILRVPKEFPG